MHIKKLVIAISLAACCLQPANAGAGFNTIDLIKDTARDMPDCLEYKINKVVLKMEMTFFGPIFYWTLNVSHNSPNWLTMTHNDLADTPFDEFNAIFGAAYETIASKIIKLADPSVAEVGAGRHQHKNWGQHQSVQFTEATVIGHPGAMILQMFGIDGLKSDGYSVGKGKNKRWHQCKTHGCLEEKNSEIGQGIRQAGKVHLTPKQREKESKKYLSNWNSGRYTNTLYNFYNYKAIHDQLKSIPSLNTFFSYFGQLFRAAAAALGAKFDRVFCEMRIAPYSPYYLSGFDALSWRGGYPIADPEHSKTIINPLSSDTIGTNVRDNLLHTKIPEKWGHIYPREGTVDIQNTAKLGAVVAYRSNSILSDHKKSGVRVYRKPHENTVGVWNKVYPRKDRTTPGATNSACHKNIANTGIRINTKGSYAYTSWPRYTCDLAGGKTILKISVNKYLTSKVPD